MKEKWLQAEIFPKSILTSLIYTIILITVGMILTVIDNSYLYGVLLGTGILYLSYLIIWLLWYRVPKIQTIMAKGTPVLSPLIRVVIFITTFLLIAFLVNEGEGTDMFLQPINLLMTLVTYTFTIVSYGTVIVIDFFLEKKTNKTTEVKK